MLCDHTILTRCSLESTTMGVSTSSRSGTAVSGGSGDCLAQSRFCRIVSYAIEGDATCRHESDCSNIHKIRSSSQSSYPSIYLIPCPSFLSNAQRCPVCPIYFSCLWSCLFLSKWYVVAKMLPSYVSAVVVKENSLSWCEARKLCKKSVKDCTAAKEWFLVMKRELVEVVVS